MITAATMKVLTEFLNTPQREQYGFGLMRTTGVKAGSLYPILDRLVAAGWLHVEDESIDVVAERRPKRKLYRLTALGEREGRRAVRQFFENVGPAPHWVPRLERA